MLLEVSATNQPSQTQENTYKCLIVGTALVAVIAAAFFGLRVYMMRKVKR
jgi:hypothetical protein